MFNIEAIIVDFTKFIMDSCQNAEEMRCLKLVKLIISDDCIVTPHHALARVYRISHDLMGQDVRFGRKGIILVTVGCKTNSYCCKVSQKSPI